MKDIFSEVNRILEKGQNGVIARIVRQQGSAPRETGTRCLILEDGTIAGTIGGGRMEYLVFEKAKTVLRNQQSAILKLALYGNNVAETEMLCGGEVELYLEPISPKNPETSRIFSHLVQMAKNGQRGVLVTRIVEGISDRDQGYRTLVLEGQSLDGTIQGLDASLLLTFLKTESPMLFETSEGAFFIDPVLPKELLYLFGAGHISTCVAPLASILGFHVVVIDDREAFANPDRFPEVDEIHVVEFQKVFQKITVNAQSYLVIVTRGHSHDLTILREALKTEAKYIGMIGSRRKRDVIYEALMKEGVRKERLSQVHCPIGLDIGAQTPEEIAVSIMGELIADKNAGKKKRV